MARRKDGGPPRWFSPIECAGAGGRVPGAPTLLYLPGTTIVTLYFFKKKVASPLLFLISLPFANCNPNALLEFEYSFAPQHTDDRVQSESSYIL
jgi:hypothetical protein